MTARMRRIDHPGAPAPERVRALACKAVPLRVTLPAGQSLSAAATDALAGAGFAFGYLRLDGAAVRPLTFVTPAPAPGDGHAAWYSDTHRAPGGVTLRHAGAHLGLRDGQPFLHCHAIWQGAPAQPDCGHLLCDDTILDADCTITGWGLQSAGLVAAPDPETAFTLFQPEARPGGDTANAHLLTLRPNQDIGAALLAFARDRGIAAARIEGIGSLVGTAFADGRTLDSYVTEILIVDGRLQDDAVTLDVASVGFDGRGMAGRLAPGANAVCVTAEILIIADA
ncbi:PCC domain-containing protein [Citreimonas sp.]|uniref:PCC domain-containing protein n=1 Tax=Citreimonas sp. TaxID=3036715 RepID=UPI004057EF09